METLYRKISVTNEKPLDKTPLFLVEITGAKNQNFPVDGNDWQFYLEEIPDPTAQLKADKEELVSFLENLSHNVFWKGRTLDSRDKLKIKTLIQKHKQ